MHAKINENKAKLQSEHLTPVGIPIQQLALIVRLGERIGAMVAY